MGLGEDCIAALDRAFARSGTTVKLRRAGWSDVNCLAAVRSPNAQELVGGYKQSDSVVILSPTSFSGMSPAFLPIRFGTGGDRAVIDGRARQIEVYSPFVVSGVLCRIELKVLG